MGVHEWLVQRGYRYGDQPQELKDWLSVYQTNIEAVKPYCKDGIYPARGRAIAPTGTVGILAETSTGIEPIFCVAYKRRYLKGNSWHYQYVVDPVARRLIDLGVSEQTIEDAYSIEPERRISFQAFVQGYVDMAISSTVNVPAWGSEMNNDKTVVEFGDILMKYLPKLRGITLYPDTSRGGQPLTTVNYKTAIKHIGEEYTEEQADVCDLRGGSCSS
jgi:ribonucleoside-diphosphate reductase alpha chain